MKEIDQAPLQISVWSQPKRKYVCYSVLNQDLYISDFQYNSDLCGIQPWSVCPKLTSDCPSPADMLYFSFHNEDSRIKNEQIL